jgi:hypothetical protein
MPFGLAGFCALIQKTGCVFSKKSGVWDHDRSRRLSSRIQSSVAGIAFLNRPERI